jgi:sugar (pentulose or hexulose) kinase
MIGFLGCDIGTTGTKTMLFNEQNDAVGRGYKAYDLFTPFENAYEQNPEDWYLSLKQSIKEAVKESELEVKALSVSAQGGSFFLADIDKNGKVIPLCPALTWMDARSGEEFEEVKQVLSKEVNTSDLTAKTNPTSKVAVTDVTASQKNHETETVKDNEKEKKD